MRGARGLLAAALAIGLASPALTPAGAHPGHGGSPVTVDGDSFAYAPAALKVAIGDTVIWTWQGSVFRNHSVTADPGQVEEFDSDPAGPPTTATHPPGDGFVHTFSHEGTFTYFCRTHPAMRGSVEVITLPSQGRPPRIRGLRIEGALATYRLSRSAAVVARIARPPSAGGRVVESLSKRGRPGKNTLRIPRADLAPGRYELRLIAYDSADRPSNEVSARFRVERG